MYLCQSGIFLLALVRGKVFVHITVHYPARGITSTIAIAIGLRVVYNVVYTGDRNKSFVQKKMKVFCFCFKVLTVS